MTKNKWEMKMHEARALRKQGLSVLHQRVKLLVACSQDAEFLAWCDDTSTDAQEYLDNEVADTCTDFTTLALVLKHVPRADQWKNRNLRELVLEVEGIITADTEHYERPRPKYKELLQESEESWQKRYTTLEKADERLKQQVADLKEEIKSLTSPGRRRRAG